MNRLEWQEYLDKDLKNYLLMNKKYFIRLEELRKQFVKDYPISRITQLTLDEYVTASPKRDSFCYRLEYATKELGNISRATLHRFGVFRRETGELVATKKYGTSIDNAFKTVKECIIDSLKYGKEKNFIELKNNMLSDLVKGKLLFIYYPEYFLNVFSIKHLKYFISKLNIISDSNGFFDLNYALIDYKNSFPELKKEKTIVFTELLYKYFGNPSHNETLIDREEFPIMNDVFPDFVTNISGKMTIQRDEINRHKSSIDYEKRNKTRKLIGDRGEKIVLKLEEKRLRYANRCDLINQIQYIAEHDDHAGYDILSFNEDGSERYIEVKATTTNDNIPFYLTANEINIAKEKQNYFIYRVFDAGSTNPHVLIIADPFNNPEYKVDLDPIIFSASLIAK